jgi:hypothetical protein
MSCAFDLDHYRELLDAAGEGGYRFATFDREPQAGDIFLRHDVDLSLEAALSLAELEQERGARATYFLMTESVFYNLDSNQHWREGCPHEELRTGAFEWLQLLVHPEIWVYDGETMGETMRAMLDVKREELLGYLAGDRIDLT